jgi:hypothetical protein
MKGILIIAFLFIAFGVAAQTAVPGEYANKFVDKVVSAYGYVYKVSRVPGSKATLVSFGSKFLSKGVILKLTTDYKLEPWNSFQNLNGKFITVTGKIIRDDKGKIIINGDDPATTINVRETLAVN